MFGKDGKRASGQKFYFYVAVYYVVHAMGLRSITNRKKIGIDQFVRKNDHLSQRRLYKVLYNKLFNYV